MLFKQELIDKMLVDGKTQTRRPVMPGDEFLQQALGEWGIKHDCVKHNGRIKWVVGRDYAVCPGRGKSTLLYATFPDGSRRAIPAAMGLAGWSPDMPLTPLRIRITEIRREDARQISKDDARAEGFNCVAEFLAVWVAFYDKIALRNLEKPDSTKGRPVIVYPGVHQRATAFLANRPAALYDAWALTFKVV